MIKQSMIAAALAAAFCAGAAQAADVQLYGRIDAGLRYTHKEGGDNSLTMQHNRATSRIGFNIKEDLGNGTTVKTYLEHGFKSDTGAMGTSGTIFDRRAILAVQGKYGELGMGRMGTVQSTVAPYSMGLIKYDPFGTSYGQASIGSTFANTNRINNAVTWISPTWNGFKVGATYGFGDSADDSAEWQQKDHTFALATDYVGENLYMNVTFAHVDRLHDEEAKLTEDSQLYGTGGWFRFVPSARIFWGAQYQKGWKEAAGVTATDLYTDTLADPADYEDDATKYFEGREGGFDGVSLLLGADYVNGPHKLIADVQFFDGELAKNKKADYQLTVLAAAYEYKFAPKVWGYIAATHSIGSGSLVKRHVHDENYDNDATELMIGMNWNF